jgi:hypothetical protein
MEAVELETLASEKKWPPKTKTLTVWSRNLRPFFNTRPFRSTSTLPALLGFQIRVLSDIGAVAVATSDTAESIQPCISKMASTPEVNDKFRLERLPKFFMTFVDCPLTIYILQVQRIFFFTAGVHIFSILLSHVLLRVFMTNYILDWWGIDKNCVCQFETTTPPVVWDNWLQMERRWILVPRMRTGQGRSQPQGSVWRFLPTNQNDKVIKRGSHNTRLC